MSQPEHQMSQTEHQMSQTGRQVDRVEEPEDDSCGRHQAGHSADHHRPAALGRARLLRRPGGADAEPGPAGGRRHRVRPGVHRAPWCLPSRSSLATGLYPRNHGAYSNFRDRSLSPELPNLYTTLGGLGYRTAHVGKCHFAPVPYARDPAGRDAAVRARSASTT